MNKSTSNKIQSLLESAIRGELKLERLHEEYPENLKQKIFWEDVWNDLESGVEHYPFKIFSGKPDLKTWNKSHELKKLKIDLALINELSNNEKRYDFRKKLLEREDLTHENIQNKIKLLLTINE